MQEGLAYGDSGGLFEQHLGTEETMKARKRIVMWSEREYDAGVITYALKTALHVTVQKCFTRADLFAALEDDPEGIYLVILIDCGNHEKTKVCADIAQKASLFCQILVVERIKGNEPLEIAGASLLLQIGKQHTGLINQAHIMVYRKRGPRAAPLTALTTPTGLNSGPVGR